MTAEQFSELHDYGIVLVEDYPYVIKLKNVLRDMGFRRVMIFASFVPENLAEEMRRRGIQLAILHANKPQAKEPVLEAHRQGFQVVVVRQEVPSQDTKEMYEAFDEAGVPAFDKRNTFLTDALTMLSEKVLR